MRSSTPIHQDRRLVLSVIMIVIIAAVLLWWSNQPRTTPRVASGFLAILTDPTLIDTAIGRTTAEVWVVDDNSPTHCTIYRARSFETDADLQLSQDLLVPIVNALSSAGTTHGHRVGMGHYMQPAYGNTMVESHGSFTTDRTRGIIRVTITRDRVSPDRKDSTVTIIIQVTETGL